MSLRRVFVVAGLVWIAANAVITAAGVVFGLGDTPVTGTTSISWTGALFTGGTIVSPPLIFMAIAGVLLWGASSTSLRVTRIATVLLVIGIAIIAFDTQGGLHAQAPQYSDQRWYAAVVLGWTFVAISAVAIIAGIAHLITSRSSATGNVKG